MSALQAISTRATVGVGALVLCALAALHPVLDPRWHAAWCVAVMSVGALGVWDGIRRHRPPRVAGWHRFAVGTTLYAVGDAIAVVIRAVAGPDHPAATAMWVLGLLAVPVAVSGIRRVLTDGPASHGREAGIDAAIAALIVGVAGWQLVVGPIVQRDGWMHYGVLGSTAFWVVTTTVMAHICRRAVGDGGISPSLALSAVGVPLTAATSLVYWTWESDVAWESAPVARVLMALSYAAIAAAVGHPSMRRLSGETPELGRSPLGHLLIVAAGLAVAPGWLLAASAGLVDRTPDVVGTVLMALLTGLCITRVAITIRARETDARALGRLAMTDPLTGLPNRTALTDRLSQATDAGEEVAVMTLDLDRFKVVNDSLGHPAGDVLLLAVTERLRHVVGSDHLVARLGGDEFVVLVRGWPRRSDVLGLAGRICAGLAAPLVVDGHGVTATTSIGVAFGGQDATADDLMRDADVALYRAKAAGGDSYAVFGPDLRAQAQRRMALEARIRAALDADGFDVAYQPIRALEGGDIVAAEALLRWRPPGPEAPGPAEMVAVAEESGLIHRLGAWVLRRVVADIREAGAALPEEVHISVNVSGTQLAEADFASDFMRILTEAGVAPSRIILEVTESVLLAETAATHQNLERLQAAGVGLAMDDFGTGYSALSALRRIRFDSVKIDREFVAGIGHDAQDTTIVHAVVGMAHALGMSVLGEGVEVDEQAALLRAAGCDHGQGFGLGRPMPWTEFLGHLSDERVRSTA